ncbi:MAG: heavy-metal-associated domain-containing protein, partial [Chloroflexi bacterium]|nr:heavy-metal-associated domain-containing protein [Chloroflexota bacterium]
MTIMTSKTEPGKKRITLQIAGMTCASCVANNEQALSGLPGVGKVVVNLATGKAMVEYDPNRVTLAQMKKAVTDIGYEVVL